MNLQIIDPTQYPGWDNLILSHPDYSFFHSSIWAEVLKKSYGYTPMYFVALGEKGISALLPVMEVKSFLTGRRGVSLPFTDYCEPICNGNIGFVHLFNQVIEFGRKQGWKYIELRGGYSFYPDSFSPNSEMTRDSQLLPARASAQGGETLDVIPSYVYFGHTLSLEKGEQSLYKGLRDSTKRNIKKARAEGVEVTISDQPESINQFYSLNSLTRKRHGLPPQPFSFFKNILELVIKKRYGTVILGFYEGKAIVASVFFHFAKKAVYKYGASDLSYQHLRANNLVMWEAIKWYSQNGYKSLCFGRTELENHGLIQFKSGWGATEHPINYYRYDLRKEAFIAGSSNVVGFHNKIFRRMPIPILNRIGNILYRHVG
jgi:hypothetical protein